MAPALRAPLAAVLAASVAASSAAERTDGVPECPCNGFAMEPQLARIISMAYEKDGPRSTLPAAQDVADCYAWKDLTYDIQFDSLISKVAKKAYSWSTPRAVFGRCSSKSETCVVSFAGAADLGMVAGIQEEGPVFLKRTQQGLIVETSEADQDGYRFHKFYWRVYSDMRDQVGSDIDGSLEGCKDIVVTGHSIGAAMASLWQWEHSELPVQQITIGQNPAWFGTPPDVGCRGKRIVSEDDPIPYLRQFKDDEGNVIRHPPLPVQYLVKGPNGWNPSELTSCDTNQPIDPECEDECSQFSLHYNMRVAKGIKSHQAAAYVVDLDSAFGSSQRDITV